MKRQTVAVRKKGRVRKRKKREREEIAIEKR